MIRHGNRNQGYLPKAFIPLTSTTELSRIPTHHTAKHQRQMVSSLSSEENAEIDSVGNRQVEQRSMRRLTESRDKERERSAHSAAVTITAPTKASI